MKELDELCEWADSVIGKYNIVEGFDAQNPVTGRMTPDEIARFRAGKPISGKQTPTKQSGPSPEIREKLKQLRSEFAGRAGIAEADQPPQGSLYSPLSAATRDKPAPDPRAALKRKREEARMRKFMGRRD
jgi:hypothetical protein